MRVPSVNATAAANSHEFGYISGSHSIQLGEFHHATFRKHDRSHHRLLAVLCIVAGYGSGAGILAEVAEPGEQNFLIWLIQCLGLFGMLAVLVAIALFFGSWIVVFAARRPAVIASYCVFLLLPLLLAVAAALKGLVAAFSVYAMADTDMKQTHIIGLLSEVLVIPLTALMLTIPTFFILATGLFIRTLFAGKSQSAAATKPSAVP